MSALHYLRQSKHIARWVLVWFALSMTAAVAAPVLNPQGLTLVCTAAGQVKLVSTSNSADAAVNSASTGAPGGADVAAGLHGHLDCVLCLSLYAPPLPDVRLPLPAWFAVQKSVHRADPHVPQWGLRTLFARGPPART